MLITMCTITKLEVCDGTFEISPQALFAPVRFISKSVEDVDVNL